jgi:hypothetical protein
MQSFIRHVIAEMGVISKYRWSEARLNQLWALGQKWKPPMKDIEAVLRDKVMAYVRAQEVVRNPLTEEL